MDREEAYFDRIMRKVVLDEEARIRNQHSTYLRNFYPYKKNAKVSLIMANMALKEHTQRIEGRLVHPELALIDIKWADEFDWWEGNTIGLAVCWDQTPLYGLPKAVYPHYCAGDRQAAYFLAEDMVPDTTDRLTVPQDKIRSLGFKYGKLAVNDTVVFNFTSH